MDDVDDLYVVGANTVDQDVVGMHNGFACLINPAGAIEKRVFGKPLSTAFNGSKQPLRSGQISLSNIADDCRQI